MPAPKILSRQDIERAMSVTKTNKDASRYLNVNWYTYRKYANRYFNEEGKSLFDIHKNPGGKGVMRLLHSRGKIFNIEKILDGKITAIEKYDVSKFKEALIRDCIFEEKCCKCGFCEPRIKDYKVPLLINFKNKNKLNWRRENLELICYNCYFLQVGDVFTLDELRSIESTQSFQKFNEVEWELDDYTKERFVELGIMDKEKDEGDEFIVFNK